MKPRTWRGGAVGIFAAALLTLPGCRSCSAPPPAEETPSPRASPSPVTSIAPEVALRWEAVDILVLRDAGPAVEVRLALGGEAVAAGDTGLDVRLDAFAPNFRMDSATQDVSSDAEPKNPAAKVVVTEAGTPVFEGWIFPFERLDEWPADPRYDLRLKAWHRRP